MFTIFLPCHYQTIKLLNLLLLKIPSVWGKELELELKTNKRKKSLAMSIKSSRCMSTSPSLRRLLARRSLPKSPKKTWIQPIKKKRPF